MRPSATSTSALRSAAAIIPANVLGSAEIIWTKRESAPDGDDPKTEDRIPAYDGEKALQEIAATRLLLVSAIASAVTPIVRIVAAISFRVGRFATLIRTPRIAAW